jgi:hypothetical protein
MEITINATGITEALAAVDPKKAYMIIDLWYLRSTDYAKRELQTRSPARLRRKVRVLFDGYKPHRWARVFVKSPLAHLLEGGTGSRGVSPFKHVGRHWPSTKGIMEATGLPKPEAFLVARSIGLRGGNPPKPFLQPTWNVVMPRISEMAEQAAAEVLR